MIKTSIFIATLFFSFYSFSMQEMQQSLQKLCEKINRPLLEREMNYLSQQPQEKLDELLQKFESLNDNNTLKNTMFNFVFFIPMQEAEEMLNQNNHINTFLVRMSLEDDEWKVLVTIKSTRSSGKPVHTKYQGQQRNDGLVLSIDQNIVGSLQLIDPSWATNMLIIIAHSIYSVPRGVICGR